jgi:hypothetical protein
MGHALHPRFAFPAGLRERWLFFNGESSKETESGLLLFVDREVVLFHFRAHTIERVVHIV